MPNSDKGTSKGKALPAEHHTSDEHEREKPEKDRVEEEPTQAKLRARSRFSAAFRSLSKSKTKKKESAEEEPQVVSLSGGEDLTSIGDISTDSGLKGVAGKKKSLTRRLLLGGLKSKAKVRPHSIATSDDLSLLSSSRDRLSLGQGLSRDEAEGGGVASAGSSSTLQITISGKKVETAKGKPKEKEKEKERGKDKGKSKSQSAGKTKVKEEKKSAASETDYLTPTPAAAAATGIGTGTVTGTGTGSAIGTGTASGSSTTTTTTTSSSSRTTKLIVSKVSKEPTLKQPKKQQQQQHLSLPLPPLSQSSLTSEEHIVITESRRDTPPRERAPAKPSRANQSASSSGTVRKSASTILGSSREKTELRGVQELMQHQQQQRGHRLSRPFTGTTETPASIAQALQTPPSPEPEPEPPTYPPPPPPPPHSLTSTIVLVSLSEAEEEKHTDNVSLAESAGKAQLVSFNPTPIPAIPQVRFAVGSAVRGPAADAYEAALAAAASQQPSSSEEPSDSSLRRLNFAHQQFALSDHDSIEGRREAVRYKSVASEYNEDSQSEDEVDELKQDVKEQATTPMPAFGDLTMEQQMEPTIMAPSSEKREHLYKILVIGELGTGKTSFIKRYVHQFFSQNYRATIGVDFALKVLHWDANTIVRLQLWDIAGQERFGNMTRVYYKEAVGAFIVFDVTRSGTFDCVSKWKEDLDSKVQLPDGSPIPCILLANKCDQEKQGIVTQPERMDEYVRENGFAGWFETSAKENINIDEAARALVNKILINDKLITADASDEDKFNLSNAGDAATDAKNKCSC